MVFDRNIWHQHIFCQIPFLIYMLIYKITNLVNGKMYVGQTIHTLEKRKSEHIRDSQRYDLLLYRAMNKYGFENFKFEIIKDNIQTQEDLNYWEKYYIKKFKTFEDRNIGYNMTEGGEISPMKSELVKIIHQEKVCSKENREKISKTMKRLRQEKGFSKETRAKLSMSAKTSPKAIAHRKEMSGDTRSISVYCIDKQDNNTRHDFHSIKDATKWWFEKYHPFGNEYAHPTLQRKIICMIKTGKCVYVDRHNHSLVISVDKSIIEWHLLNNIINSSSRNNTLLSNENCKNKGSYYSKINHQPKSTNNNIKLF